MTYQKRGRWSHTMLLWITFKQQPSCFTCTTLIYWGDPSHCVSRPINSESVFLLACLIAWLLLLLRNGYTWHIKSKIKFRHQAFVHIHILCNSNSYSSNFRLSIDTVDTETTVCGKEFHMLITFCVKKFSLVAWLIACLTPHSLYDWKPFKGKPKLHQTHCHDGPLSVNPACILGHIQAYSSYSYGWWICLIQVLY